MDVARLLLTWWDDSRRDNWRLFQRRRPISCFLLERRWWRLLFLFNLWFCR